MAARTVNHDALCPACERFIGPLDTCPYCDSPSPKPFSLRVLRMASLAMAVIGTGLLYLAARQGEIPVVEVGAVTPVMNSAYIRVGGRVAAAPRSGLAGTVYVSFPLSDGSNRLTVVAFNRCAQRLICATNVPQRGAVVEVAGVVSISRPGERRIIMESPDQLKVIRTAPGPKAVAEKRGWVAHDG